MAIHKNDSLLIKSLMTMAERQALDLHNLAFTKPAIRLVAVGGWRFYVEYADGETKWDYGCGDMSARLGRIANQPAIAPPIDDYKELESARYTFDGK